MQLTLEKCMLMEITFKTQLLTQFSKRVAIKEQKDPRRLSLGQSIWPLGVTATLKEQNAAECMMSCIMDLARFIFTRLTGNKLCNIYYTQYRCSVGTSCNPTRGASRVDHKKKKKPTQKAMWGHYRSWLQSPAKYRTSVLLASVCGPVAPAGDCSFCAFFSQSRPVQFTICRWKNVDVELPNVNACSWARMRSKK